MNIRLHRFTTVIGLVVLILLTGSLALVRPGLPSPLAANSLLTPPPTEDGPSLKPGIDLPVIPPPTEQSILPPRQTPTPRVMPTPAGVPTQEPTTAPIDPNPTVEVQPTEALPPAPPPTVTAGLDEDGPTVPLTPLGSLTVTTKLCPPAFDLNQAWDIPALEQQCTGNVYKVLHSLRFSPELALGQQLAVEYNGVPVSFTVAPGMRWLGAGMTNPPTGGPKLTHVSITCITPPGTEPEFPVFAFADLSAVVQIKANQTTSCTRYVRHPAELGTVTVHAWDCAPGYDLTAPGATPSADCAQPVDGVYLVLLPGTFAAFIGNEGHTGDTSPGTLTMEDVIPGNYHGMRALLIPPESHAGWSMLSACGTDPVAVAGTMSPVNGSVHPGIFWLPALTVPSGGTIECNIYVVPPAAASQTIPPSAGRVALMAASGGAIGLRRSVAGRRRIRPALAAAMRPGRIA